MIWQNLVYFLQDLPNDRQLIGLLLSKHRNLSKDHSNQSECVYIKVKKPRKYFVNFPQTQIGEVGVGGPLVTCKDFQIFENL